MTRTVWPRLDGLRGLAILLVIAHNGETLDAPAGALARALLFVADHGWIGVQLFFVLSGYLITAILLDTRGAPNHYASFFARRTLRIFPLYYATLAVVLWIVPALTGQPPAGSGRTVWLWLYLGNWVQWRESIVDVLPHLWSLAVEEQFYLVWPFLLHRAPPRSALRLCAGIAAASFASRVAMRGFDVPPDALYMSTIARIDAMALGGAVAAWLRCGPRAAPRLWERRPLASAAAILLPAALYTHGFPRLSAPGQTVGYTALAAAFALLVLHAVASRPGSGAAWRAPLQWTWLRAVGRRSYAMYLFHMPLNLALAEAYRRAVPASTTSAAACLAYIGALALLSFALAVASHHAFEKHFLQLKSRYEARAAAQPA